MLTRVEIDGFKSLREFSVELEPLTAIVGANGAGKSNFFEALELVYRLMSMDLLSALKRGRGAVRDQFSRTGDGIGNAIFIALEFLLLPRVVLSETKEVELSRTRVRYEVKIERVTLPSGLEQLGITHELLRSLSTEEDQWIEQHPQFKAQARHGTGGEILKIIKEFPASAAPIMVIRSGYDHVALRDPWPTEWIEQAPDLLEPHAIRLAVWQNLFTCFFLRLDPLGLRLSSETTDLPVLYGDNSNLPTVLKALPEEAQARVRANLVRFVPGVKDFEVITQADKFRLDLVLMDGQRMPAELLSDGTLRIIAILAVLYSTHTKSLIAIEEPENGIYPGRLRAFLDELAKDITAEGPQFLFNSHSSTIVAALQKIPGALLFADLVYRDGLRSTRLRRVQAHSPDRGATTVSPKEVERFLASVRSEEMQ